MRRTEQLQGLRLMKFEDVYGRCYRGDLSQAEASEILGMSERTFRRWRERYEAEGAAGLYDRRLGRVSARRAPVDEVMRVLELFETRYPDFTAKHFHEKLVCEHGFGLSYNWLRLSLQAHGKIKPAPRRGAHRRKRPRRPVVGMMLHQDGSSHEWVAGQWWDLIVTMGCDIGGLFGLLRCRGGHDEHVPRARRGDRRKRAVLLALRRSGLALLAHARGRRRCGQGQPDPGRPGLGAARHRVDRGLFAAGPGPLGAHVRDLAEAPAPGAAPRRDRHHGRGQSLSRGALLAGAQRPLRPAADTGSAFVAFAGTLEDILCAQEDRVVAGDNTVRYKNRTLQIPADRHRHHYVKAQVRVHEYPDGHLAVFHGPRCLARYRADGETIDDDRLQAA